MSRGLVIVGGCYAAAQIAASAREAGYAEPIRIVSQEAFAPYQRPPLSKGFLTGKVPQAALPLRGEAFYRENRVELLLDTRATRIDRASRVVETADGQRLSFDKLALAVGARPRPLPIPGSDLDGVLELRSLADSLAIRERLADASSVVIVGNELGPQTLPANGSLVVRPITNTTYTLTAYAPGGQTVSVTISVFVR